MGAIGTIKGRLLTLAAAVLVAIGTIVVAWWLAFNEFKVNGPVYARVVLAKDLIADILPPPEYILEAYLVTTQALTAAPSEVPVLKTRLAALRADYDTRHTYWQGQPLDRSVAAPLLDQSYQPALRFFELAEDTFFPALERGDRVAAGIAFTTLTRFYETHRAAIDEAVLAANALTHSVESGATDGEARAKGLVLLVSALLALGGVAITLGVAHSVIGPLGRMSATARQLGQGDTVAAVPDTGRTDEIGPLARAMEDWRLKLIEEVARRDGEQADLAAREARSRHVETTTRQFEDSVVAVMARVRAAVAAIAGIAATISRITQMSAAIAGAVTQQGAATSKIARNVSLATQDTREVATNINGVAQAAGETGRLARAVLGDADDLRDQSAVLEHEISRFLADVNATCAPPPADDRRAMPA